MLISVRQLKWIWRVKPRGVLHVGAHEAEERFAYSAAGWVPVLWVEALPDKVEAIRRILRDYPGHGVISALAWDSDAAVLTMNRTNNVQSSSVLEFGTHATEHPDVHVVEKVKLRSSRLDTTLSAVNATFDFLVLDIQGAELRALRGLGERLHEFRWIFCEVNEKPLYVGLNLVDEIDAYLARFGFSRVDTQMTSHGWGDALYVREDVVPTRPELRRRVRRLGTRVVKNQRLARLKRLLQKHSSSK